MRSRLFALVVTVALLLSSVSAPALAQGNGNGKEKAKGNRISQQFADMGDFQWGLQDVTKMAAKGVFKGRANNLFAPGAKIARQEAAVALVRLIGREAEAQALSSAEVEALLANMPDQTEIAAWARPAVAMLVKLGVLERVPFGPNRDATRLDVAVLLVKGLGYEAEAHAKMNTALPFKDAHLIPSELAGYVATAVDHKLITGYDDRTFRPHQGVKRVEMAVMMGRADNQIERPRQDEYQGTIKSVNAAQNSFVITTVQGRDLVLTLAEDASIFVDLLEKSLTDLVAGMSVRVKLNDEGKVEYAEATSVAPTPVPAVTGEIAGLIQPTATSLGLITMENAIYPVSGQAEITLNGEDALFGDLKVGDSVALNVRSGLAVKVAATRAAVVVTGSIAGLTVATTSAPGTVTVNGTTFALDPHVSFAINGEAASFGDLRVGDPAVLTLEGNQVQRIEVTRTVTAIEGAIAALTAAVPASGSTPAVPAQILVSAMINGNVSLNNYAVPSSTQILVNGAAVQFSDLHLGDAIKVTLWGNDVHKVEVSR